MTLVTLAGESDPYARVRAEIEAASAFDRPLVVVNGLATVVACYGLLLNSGAVVIGATILAMLLGPISRVAPAPVDGYARLLRGASLAVVGGVLVVLVTAIVLGLVHRDVPVTDAIMARTSPNFFELMIALAGGAAGAYASISPRLSIAFVGVAIATAMVPPLASCGLLLARGDFELAEGAALLTFVNIVAIQSGASFVMWASGIARLRWGKLLAPKIIGIGVLLPLAGFLVANLRTLVGAALFEACVSQDIKLGLADYPGTFVADLRVSRRAGTNVTIVQAVLRGPRELSAGETGRLEDRLPHSSDGSRLELRLRQIHTSVMTRTGPLYSSGEAENGDR